MESVAGPVVAGIIVRLRNRYVLDFKWCVLPENWRDCDDDVEGEDENDSDMTPSSTTISPLFTVSAGVFSNRRIQGGEFREIIGCALGFSFLD